jgi:hypothetical protein
MANTATRLSRWRLIETLVETASPAGTQVRLMEDGHFPYVELARQFWDWWDRVPMLDRAGALSPEALEALQEVNDTFMEIDRVTAQATDDTDYLWTAEAIRTRPEWEAVRGAATTALRAFEAMGLPIPSLADPDFNKPRTDAP